MLFIGLSRDALAYPIITYDFINRAACKNFNSASGTCTSGALSMAVISGGGFMTNKLRCVGIDKGSAGSSGRSIGIGENIKFYFSPNEVAALSSPAL
jgi:hypothetical protein